MARGSDVGIDSHTSVDRVSILSMIQEKSVTSMKYHEINALSILTKIHFFVDLVFYFTFPNSPCLFKAVVSNIWPGVQNWPA